MISNLEYAFIPLQMAVPDKDTGDLAPFVMPGPDYWVEMGPMNLGRLAREEDFLMVNPGWMGGAVAKFIRSKDVDNLNGMKVYNHYRLYYDSLVVRPIPFHEAVLNVAADFGPIGTTVKIQCRWMSGNMAFQGEFDQMKPITAAALHTKVKEHLMKNGTISANTNLKYIRFDTVIKGNTKVWKTPKLPRGVVRRPASSASSTQQTMKSFCKRK